MFPTWIYSCRLRGTVSWALPFMTNGTISTSVSQICLSWVTILSSLPSYGLFISRYAMACSSYECFILRAARLSCKLPGQGYVRERLKSPLRKFDDRYGVSNQTLWISPLPNVTRHSGTWSYTLTPSIDQTFVDVNTLFREVSIEYLQLVQLSDRGR